MPSVEIHPYTLQFKKPAKTSRNVFMDREVFFIRIKDDKGNIGIGEAGPLKHLSIDDREDYKERLQELCDLVAYGIPLEELDLEPFPSIQFGLESAFLDLNFKEEGKLFDTPFSKSQQGIKINGLVWMSDCQDMLHQAFEKAEQGFTCIKFKVGAQDFDEECRMLESLRNRYSAFKLEIRLDANGAFGHDVAMEQLAELNRFEIHSIEQPIKPKQWDAMTKICRESKIDIALDEELIGLANAEDRVDMISFIKPQYIILKPNLIGGFQIADHWISLARKYNVNWWATSALESDVGLNAIAQWLSTYSIDLPQGLGTGSLFRNNIKSHLNLEGEMLSIGLNDLWHYPF